jgi:hypothetical protein
VLTTDLDGVAPAQSGIEEHIEGHALARSYAAAMIKTPGALYRGHRFPAEVFAPAIWHYFRFPLSLRTADGLLAARGVTVIEIVGQPFAAPPASNHDTEAARTAPIDTNLNSP